MYMVMSLAKELDVEVPGCPTKRVPIGGDGCLGFLPVFDTREAAEQYATTVGGAIEELEYDSEVEVK